MLFGSHVSAAGGLADAPARAHAVGCDVFQIFSRSPRGGKAPQLTQENIDKFRSECKKYKLQWSYIHAPYYINLASDTPRIRHGSTSVLQEELQRGSSIGAESLMTHLGSAKDFGRQKSVEKTIGAVCKILEKPTKTIFLLEQSAGAGGENGIIGGSLEELGDIYKGVLKKDKKLSKSLGICIDTCHAFAMGYDLRTKKAVDDFVKQIDKFIGLQSLRLFHFNDSKFDLGEHKDRHEHIGRGKIGKEGFRAIINHPKLKHLNAILETPKDKSGKFDKMNLKLLRSLNK